MFLVIALVAAAAVVAVVILLLLGYRVIKAAHQRPEAAAGHSHSSAGPGAHSPSGLQRFVLGTISRVIRLSLKLGVRLGPMMMLTVRGRKTGLPRTNPVDLFGRDGRHWLVATHDAGASWVTNLRAAGEGALSRGRHHYTFTATELSQQEAGAVLKQVLGPRLARRFAGFVLRTTLGVPHDAPLSAFIAAAEQHPVFELSVSRASKEAVGDVGGSHPDSARPPLVRLPVLAIVVGLLAVLAHVTLGATGVMTTPQWISGVVAGVVVAGLGNHFRIFGRR
jgi:deazaflavin-dependent oxidoreductase (nitroreductase family)